MNSTAAALQTIYFSKRSTSNTGGTETNPAATAWDSGNSAATAVAHVYTAAPALGTIVGNLQIVPVASSVLASAPGNANVQSYLGPPNVTTFYQAATLRGTGQWLCANYNGAALTSGWTAGYDMTWTEE